MTGTPNVPPRRKLWTPDDNEIGYDFALLAENILTAAGIRLYCDLDPFRLDCMRATMRRLEAMIGPRPDPPSMEERLEAIDELKRGVEELLTVINNPHRIDYKKAYEIQKANVERHERIHREAEEDEFADDGQ